MAEPWLSTGEKLTEFFASDQIEASGRRTKFVQRASKITGKLFLALVTFGRWSAPKTTGAQLAAKAPQLKKPVEFTPAALQQRMTARAVTFLREVLQLAFAQLQAVGTRCEEGLFAAFGRVHLVDSTGFGLPESLAAEFPGAGGSDSKAGAKLQLVWDYQSQTFEHFALLAGNVPDNQYGDTGVALAQPHPLFLCDLGYFKLAAFAKIAAAYAYFLRRFNHQTTLREVIGGRTQPLDLPQCLRQDSRALLEKTGLLGMRDQGAARLMAVRMPEALVNERRRQARAVAKKRGDTPSQAPRTFLGGNLFVTNVPGTIWPPQMVGKAYAFRWQVELVFKAWKSGRHLATLTSTVKHGTLGYLYGRMLLIVLTGTLGPSLRAAAWQQQQREVSLLKLVRHFQASADSWFQALFQSGGQLTQFLARACAAAEPLVTKEVRKRPTSAQSLRNGLELQLDFFEPTLALAACSANRPVKPLPPPLRG